MPLQTHFDQDRMNQLTPHQINVLLWVFPIALLLFGAIAGVTIAILTRRQYRRRDAQLAAVKADIPKRFPGYYYTDSDGRTWTIEGRVQPSSDTNTLDELISDPRLEDLAKRLVATGSKCCAVSASETHEISDWIKKVKSEWAEFRTPANPAPAPAPSVPIRAHP